jgi:arylsulfatase A-like enzyme
MNMTRRDLVKLAFTASVPSGLANKRSVLSSQPHILLLMADQHRGDCLAADGNRTIHTPNLDRIAREGVLFRRAYSSTPTCTPARSALLTGLSPWHHGMLGMIRMAERYPFEKPQALRDAGYYTIAIGKQHFSPMRNGHGYHHMVLDEHCDCGRLDPQILQSRVAEERCDYEAWFWSEAPHLNPHATGLGWNDYPAKPYALPERLHPTTWTGNTAVNFINGYNGKAPLFLKVSFIRPHSPYDPPERFIRLYEDADLPPARVSKWAARYAKRNSDRNDIWRGQLSPEVIRRSRQGYYGSVSHVDEQIGRILEALEKRGWLEETLIIYTSDHGDMTGDQNLWRKSYAYEPSARVPMLMRWPAGMLSVARGQVMSQVVELRDVLPTFLDAASISAPRPLDGQSLLSLVKNQGAGWREYIDLEHNICYSPENHWNALTDGRWKYIFHALNGEEQLFDLSRDPYELVDLASETQYEAELRRWRQRLVEHFAERGEPFLKNGRLALRPKGQATSPHFPRSGSV